MKFSNANENKAIIDTTKKGDSVDILRELRSKLTDKQLRTLQTMFNEVMAVMRQYGSCIEQDMTEYKISMIKTMQQNKF